ncbi:hypothetical protein SAMN05443665_100261 [Actinomadura meyerae]|uniref:Uncharacterized protein n=1 Tax=Actinomadura meyerae TaxID=240840 RepID=A0A239D2B6_9ACTN|nr:hypothetical protein [Actinomadura meyerae]SNS26011.1 hypothetical protein SAMN05443665_100261 [Actinomadura meyerae]
MRDATGRPPEELARELAAQECRTEGYGRTLAVSLGTPSEQKIACDGRRFRWGGERGHVLGEVGAEPALVERTVLMLGQIVRWA